MSRRAPSGFESVNMQPMENLDESIENIGVMTLQDYRKIKKSIPGI